MSEDLKFHWWDISKALSCQRLFSWIVGIRRRGKTYGCKKEAIRRFLKNGSQFVYIRRFKTEIGKKMDRFFHDVGKEEEFKEVKFDSRNNTFIINGKIAGYAMTLSQAVAIKGDVLPMINFIIFDEFIIEGKGYHYIPDELDLFFSMCYTIISERENVLIFCLANSCKINNPYFLKLKLVMPPEDKVWLSEFHFVENFAGKQTTKKLSTFQRFLETTEYGKMALDNQFVDNSDTFIEKKPLSRCIFNVTYKGEKFGVWRKNDWSKLYISRDFDPSVIFHFALTTDDHEPNTMLLKQAKKGTQLRLVFEYWERGFLRFEDVNIKNMMLEVLSKTV